LRYSVRLLASIVNDSGFFESVMAVLMVPPLISIESMIFASYCIARSSKSISVAPTTTIAYGVHICDTNQIGRVVAQNRLGQYKPTTLLGAALLILDYQIATLAEAVYSWRRIAFQCESASESESESVW
jgi:hypothetical protein